MTYVDVRKAGPLYPCLSSPLPSQLGSLELGPAPCLGGKKQ